MESVAVRPSPLNMSILHNCVLSSSICVPNCVRFTSFTTNFRLIKELINEKLKKAEELGEQGMVDEAQKALEEAEALKKLTPRPEPAADSAKYTAADVRIAPGGKTSANPGPSGERTEKHPGKEARARLSGAVESFSRRHTFGHA